MLCERRPFFSFLTFTFIYISSEYLFDHVLAINMKNSSQNLEQTSGNAKQLSFLYSNEKGIIRRKRGIVIIDEDFDKLPDTSIKQSWSGGSLEPDEIRITEKSLKEWITEEGSGSSISEQSSTLDLKTTVNEFLMTKEILPMTSIDDIPEGSGDDVLTSEPTTPKKDVSVTDISSFVSCLNFTCNDRELRILPGFVETVPEDTSLTFLCSTSNYTSEDSLRWYRSNDSDNFVMETSSNTNQLHFALPNAKVRDSGKYMCIKISQQSCCHRQLDVTIYKKPNYKYHLLIVGLVAAVSLFTCLLLGIHRKYKLKQYKKELKTQIPLDEFLL